MSEVYPFQHKSLILDACCIINLYATDRMADILQVIPVQCQIASYVKDKEAKTVFDGTDEDGKKRQTPIDLYPMVISGLIRIVEPDLVLLSPKILSFAVEGLGNGEAISGAIAHQYGWAIGTDEVKATKAFARILPQLQVVTTYELVRYWAVAENISGNVLRDILEKIRIRGKFIPAQNHPLYEWAMRVMSAN